MGRDSNSQPLCDFVYIQIFKKYLFVPFVHRILIFGLFTVTNSNAFFHGQLHLQLHFQARKMYDNKDLEKNNLKTAINRQMRKLRSNLVGFTKTASFNNSSKKLDQFTFQNTSFILVKQASFFRMSPLNVFANHLQSCKFQTVRGRMFPDIIFQRHPDDPFDYCGRCWRAGILIASYFVH